MAFSTPTPQEQPTATRKGRRSLSIGLPASSDPSERRFPLTPEGAGILVSRGFTVKIESGAGKPIHYTDRQYSSCGATIVSRDETLRCDMVIHLPPLGVREVMQMRRGAMLLTLFQPWRQTAEGIRALLSRGIIAIAIDLIRDNFGNRPFAGILSEIAGRAAIAIGASLLADPIHGKGILLGGVAGVVPCEALILGSGIDASAAARSAIGNGAIVRMFDNDIYSLRNAQRELGPGLIGSALHPRVVQSALRTADIVIIGTLSSESLPYAHFDIDAIGEMKRGVIIFDLTGNCGKVFPSLKCIDLATMSPLDMSPTEPSRAVYVNVGSAVPRTAAMALSNTFITMFSEIMTCEGTVNALKLVPGLQKAAYTFLGKVVNPEIAAIAGIRPIDISIYLTLS